MRFGLSAVLLDDRVSVEAPRDGLCVVKPPQRGGHPPNGFRPPHLLGRNRAAVDESGHEPALLFEEARHLRAEPHLCGPQAGLMLDPPVDPEQAGLGAAHPKDEGLPVHVDLEVVVGDAARQRYGPRAPVGPEPLDGSLRVQLSPSLGCD